jgi:Inorganic H+ pyrophosphatase
VNFGFFTSAFACFYVRLLFLHPTLVVLGTMQRSTLRYICSLLQNLQNKNYSPRYKVAIEILWFKIRLPVQAGASEHARSLGPKGSDPHKAAVIGDTIGDPLKDTSGPSLNILIKLMAVESLVFAPFFATHGGILFKYL